MLAQLNGHCIEGKVVVNNQGDNVNGPVICQIVPTMPFDLHTNFFILAPFSKNPFITGSV